MSIKIIIADKNIKNIKFIMNKIINSIEEINIKSYVATTEEELLKILISSKIRTIIMKVEVH